ncbi:MAG: hypothetical protein AAFQ71_11410 [Planctomycetota bacterium]
MDATKTAVVVFASIMGAVTIGSLSGCDLGDVIKVKTPSGIARTEGIARNLTLNEAQHEYELVHAAKMANLEEWRGRIDRGAELQGMLSQLALDGLNTLGPSVAGVPVVGPALVGALPIASFFFGQGRLRKQKEASYNAGLTEGGQQAVRAVAEATKPPTVITT